MTWCRRGVTGLLLVTSLAPAGARAQPAPTYEGDVAAIVAAHCAPCHRDGGAAPFSLTDYPSMARRAPQIAEVTSQRYMPPWLPERGDVAFEDERRLPDHAVDVLRRWADAGAPRRSPTVEAPPSSVAVPAPALPAPDLVVAARDTIDVPADGADQYRNIVIPVATDGRRYVRALELRAGSRAVHHAVIGLDRTRQSRHLDAQDPGTGFDGMLVGALQTPDGQLLGWTPGKRVRMASPGAAWTLEAGTDLVLQLHLVPTGAPERVTPVIALYFTDVPPTVTPSLVRVGARAIDIPAGAAAHTTDDRFEFPVDAELVGLYPHAHYLARAMRVEAVLPGGGRATLLDIRRWDFNWQDEYRLVAPMRLPRGTRVQVRITYDNSPGNPRNPHTPPRRVVFGPRTSDEMGDVWMQVTTRSAADRARLMHDVQVREAASYLKGYRTLVATQPGDARHRLTLGTLLAADGQHDEAVRVYSDAVARDATMTMARYNMALSLIVLHRPSEAERQLRRAIETRHDYPEAWHALGHVHALRGEPREARAAMARALALWPEYVEARLSLAASLAGSGQLDEAIAAARLAVQLAPTHREGLNNLGILLARAGRYDESVAILARAVAAHPGDPASRANLEAARARAAPP